MIRSEPADRQAEFGKRYNRHGAMAFTFRKNSRGISEFTFPLMRSTIIPVTRKLFDVQITGREYMPLTGPCFIYGNHSNIFDPFMINVEMTLEPTAGVMTRDQFHKTIPRIFMDSIGIVPTSKYIPDPGIVRDVIRMIEQKRMIVIFPEGGRRWDGRPKPVIETTLRLFWKMGIPVHPVQLHGSWLAWPRWAKWPRMSRVEARWLPPLHASDFDNYDHFASACLAHMNFEEYDAPEETRPYRAWKPAAGIGRFLYRCPETGESAAVWSPDGIRVISRTDPKRYTMDPASRLIDPHGEPVSLIALYDRICRMEMVADREGVLLEETGSRFYEVDSSHRLRRLGRGVVRLRGEGVEYHYGSVSGFIPLEEIRFQSVEKARKVSITDRTRTLQFTVQKHAALQWQHYLRRLMKGERPVTGRREVRRQV